jgi:hypothetical protein
MWSPINLKDLFEEIQESETELKGELWNFWQLIRINPEKWTEKEYGTQSGGFWAVALCGRKVLWYNDIEEGFNVSDYITYGEIDGYYCNQDKLHWSVIRLFDLVKFGGQIKGQLGPPENLK